MAALSLIAATVHLVTLQVPSLQMARQDMRANERQAVLNLLLIREAQEDYREMGMGFAEKQVYATFFTHLWTAVGDDHLPIPLDLIPRELAFASGVSTAVSGYWYDDLHLKALPDGSRIDLELQEEWAVFAMPAVIGESGRLCFIVSGEGMWSMPAKYVPDAIPVDPEAEGWTPVP
jgi:hypothetical protein